MELREILEAFRAADPAKMKERYLAEGKTIVLTAPVYTPEEIVHSMGLVPMGVWGADTLLERSKRYFPAFICSIAQSIVELGMRGTYDGASAIVIPSLCDSLKVLGQNWKYAVPSIPFVPMTYPQNRANEAGRAFAKAGYLRVVRDLEAATGAKFSAEALAESIKIYNEHNAVMRRFAREAGKFLSASDRSAVFKSAFFMPKEEHTALVKKLLAALEGAEPASGPSVVTTGILADSPAILAKLDELGLRVAADDVAAESRQYRTDAPEAGDPLGAVRVLDGFKAGVNDGDPGAHRRRGADVVRVQLRGAAADLGVERSGVDRLLRVERQVERADGHAAVFRAAGEFRMGEGRVVAPRQREFDAGDAGAREGFEKGRVRMRNAAGGNADRTCDHGCEGLGREGGQGRQRQVAIACAGRAKGAIWPRKRRRTWGKSRSERFRTTATNDPSALRAATASTSGAQRLAPRRTAPGRMNRLKCPMKW